MVELITIALTPARIKGEEIDKIDTYFIIKQPCYDNPEARRQWIRDFVEREICQVFEPTLNESRLLTLEDMDAFVAKFGWIFDTDEEVKRIDLKYQFQEVARAQLVKDLEWEDAEIKEIFEKIRNLLVKYQCWNSEEDYTRFQNELQTLKQKYLK